MTHFARIGFISLLAALLAASSAAAFAEGRTFTIDPYHTQVRFSWDHAGFSNPGAVVNASKGTLVWHADNPSQSSVHVVIPAASIDTGVPALNAMFKSKFFEVNKYPTITFDSTRVQRVGQSNHYRIQGQLTLHGVTRPVTLQATLNKIGQLPLLKVAAIGFDATATISRSEFGLGQFIPLVDDGVTLHITLQAVAPGAMKALQQMVTGKSGA